MGLNREQDHFKLYQPCDIHFLRRIFLQLFPLDSIRESILAVYSFDQAKSGTEPLIICQMRKV